MRPLYRYADKITSIYFYLKQKQKKKQNKTLQTIFKFHKYYCIAD